MNIELIESKIDEIISSLEDEVMSIVSDDSLDKMQTNLRIKPLTSTKQILLNALDSIKMVDRLNQEERQK